MSLSRQGKTSSQSPCANTSSSSLFTTVCCFRNSFLNFSCLTLKKLTFSPSLRYIFYKCQRYLQENRWNNLAHKVLEKIACLLIMNNRNFFRTKEMNKNNMADEFLNMLIESFTNKKHIFLKSLRFTSQGTPCVIQAIYMHCTQSRRR